MGEGNEAGATPRLQLWPLWAVPLGLWFPLEFLSIADGYHHFLHWRQFPFVYAAGWSAHALLLFAAVLVLSLVLRIALRSARLVTLAQAVILVAARTFAGIVLLYLVLDWLHVVAPKSAPSIRLLWLALGSATVSILLTRHRPQAGPLLQLCRGVAIGSAIVAAVLLPLEALLTAIHNRKQPSVAELKHGDKPDVVLITVDTLGAKHMSVYGYERPTTPQLEKFAAQAATFDRAYSNANFTTPSIASILYGARPWTHRATTLYARPEMRDRDNLLSRFHDAGYRVMTIDTNPPASPAHQKLAAWVDDSESLAVPTSGRLIYWPAQWIPSFGANLIQKPLRRTLIQVEEGLIGLGYHRVNEHFSPTVALGAARRLWQARDDRPRFLWVHLFGPHDPYATPDEFIGYFDGSPEHRSVENSSPMYEWLVRSDAAFPAGYVGRYDESVRYFDHHIGEFLDWLKQRGDFDPAVIAVSADHGESFTHGYGGHGGPLLSEDLIHIPLIVKTPHSDHASRNAALIEQIDLSQMLPRLAGIDPVRDAEGRGVSLDSAPDDDPAFAMNFERNRRFDALSTGSIAMLQGPWKYVHYLNLKPYPMMPAMSDELYDLSHDPGEQANLLAQEPERAARMKAAILAELDKHDDPIP